MPSGMIEEDQVAPDPRFTKYYAKKPITHKGHHYRPGDEITGFTGWWRYWMYLRYASVNQVDNPDAPVITAITPGDTILTLAVTAASVGGDPFTNFEYKLDAGEWTAFDPADIESPFLISGLVNGRTYAVKVRADNVGGPGIESDAVNGTPATKPDIPTELVATPSDTSISIAFAIDFDGGDTVTDVQYKIGTGAWVSTDPATTATPIVVPDLTAGTEYSIRLRATNAMGTSNQSNAVVSTTLDVPTAPTDLVATAGNETVSIAFTASDDSGSAILEYEYSLNDGTDWFGTTPDTTASPMVLSLPNDVEYTLILRAKNAIGNGAASDPVVFTPADQVPGIPTDLVATPSPLSISLAFTAPDNGGSAILEYEYTFNDGADWFGTTPDTTVSPMVLSVPAADYTIKIRAKNAVGNGGASEAVTVTVPAA